MNRLKRAAAMGVVLIGSMTGCADNTVEQLPDTTLGQLVILTAAPASPGDVVAIHVAVTSPDFVGSVDTDLVQQMDSSWRGTVLDVPPGANRTVTADGFDTGMINTFEGITTNVTVHAGKLTNLDVTLKPVADGPFEAINTPPHFTALAHPDSIASTDTDTLFATAADPDLNTQLTYTWTVLQGGGTFSDNVISNQTPGNAVGTIYTPASGFDGFVVIQVAVSDGQATTTTTFPIAVGASFAPNLPADIRAAFTTTHVETAHR